MVGRLGEIDAMMHVTKSGTIVQVTWTEEETLVSIALSACLAGREK
jgi:hypothetical protein